MTKLSKTIELSNGVEIPRVGFGVWKIDNEKVSGVVQTAIKAGYRHVDTARAYKNEEGVGKGIKKSGLDRKKMFVTTKLAVQDFSRPEEEFERSLEKLKMDYVDLYLLHWPFIGWKNAWKELEKIYKEGKARSIGVSNFNIKQLEEIKRMGGMKPMVNQVEISPFINRKELVAYCQTEGIVVEAYSPLTRGKRLGDKVINDLAKEYRKTAAQIMIRWGLQHDLVMLPKSETEEHIKSNIEVFDFEIKAADMKKLDSLNENYSALFPGWSRK